MLVSEEMRQGTYLVVVLLLDVFSFVWKGKYTLIMTLMAASRRVAAMAAKRSTRTFSSQAEQLAGSGYVHWRRVES